MISFILPVRDRDKKRIKNCVRSLKSDITEEIIIVDYGSIKPLTKISGTTIIRYDKNKYFNKSHALNLGIKKSKGKYIACIDCDIILSPNFIDKLHKYLNGDVLVISRNLRRVHPKDISDFGTSWKMGRPWVKNGMWPIHAVGGIQIFSRRWINKVHGYNENLVLIGGMDSRLRDQAIMDEIPIIDINLQMIHQEHKFVKNDQFKLNPTFKMCLVRDKLEYLDQLNKESRIINRGYWGEETPNQKKFLHKEKNLSRKEKKYQKALIEAVKNGDSSFKFGGDDIKIFR